MGVSSPLTIVYEDDLERDPAATTERLLHRIGVSVPGAWRPSEPAVRQADGLNDQWLRAYHRDAAGVLAHHEKE